ncbi:hypothetical protein H6F89_07855 [Cyanobacteria bacterium FACHB-63]|nr:hypothetical protein [Cyanobacteria bacterium FACHB-63]
MRHQSSWIRYGLARLRPFGRPVVWAPAIALLFLVLFTWEFFSRTEVARELENPTVENTLSPEDRAIGADIDSLSLLMNDIKAASRPETAQFLIAPTATEQNAATSNRLFSTPTNAIAQSEPETQETTGTLRSASLTELGLPYTMRHTMQPATSETALPPNRLQEALTKLATENRPIVSQTPIEGTIRLDTNPGTSINATPQNSFSSLIEGIQPIVPGTIPTVSAPLPIAPPINAPVPSPVAPQSLTPQPVEAQNFGVMQNAPVVNQQPFTVPRSIPGRTIGGGNINTFSNP